MPLRAPWTISVLTVQFVLLAAMSAAGAFVFAFPFGDTLGYVIGASLLLAATGYLLVAWRLWSGQRTWWYVALVLPLVHESFLIFEFFYRYGGVPAEDLVPLAIVLTVEVFVLLPTTRRFFLRPVEPIDGASASA